jgi:GTP cyclohydrolase I
MAARRRGTTTPADRAALARAVQAFLEASGAPLDDPELGRTAQRTADAWHDEFLDGYRRTPAEALGTPLPAGGRPGLVAVTQLDFTGVCPHHLLPYRGVAHVGFLPGAGLVGLGRLATLVDTLAHRLSLQEVVAQQAADALVDVLGARGAAVILETEQACLSMRGEKRPRSRTFSEASAGGQGAPVLKRLRKLAAGAK